MKIKRKPFMNAVLTRPESITELAVKAGVSASALYSALNTERSSLETLTKICKVIGGKELNIALNDKFSPAARHADQSAY